VTRRTALSRGSRWLPTLLGTGIGVAVGLGAGATNYLTLAPILEDSSGLVRELQGLLWNLVPPAERLCSPGRLAAGGVSLPQTHRSASADRTCGASSSRRAPYQAACHGNMSQVGRPDPVYRFGTAQA